MEVPILAVSAERGTVNATIITSRTCPNLKPANRRSLVSALEKNRPNKSALSTESSSLKL